MSSRVPRRFGFPIAVVLTVAACSSAATPAPTAAPSKAPASAATSVAPTATPLPGTKKFSVGFTSAGISSAPMMAALDARKVPGAILIGILATAVAGMVANVAGLGAGVDPAHVVLTASSSESYSWLFKLWCDPGDRVPADESPSCSSCASW